MYCMPVALRLNNRCCIFTFICFLASRMTVWMHGPRYRELSKTKMRCSKRYGSNGLTATHSGAPPQPMKAEAWSREQTTS